MSTILSTKILLPNQRELLLGSGLSFVHYNAIKIKMNDFTLSRKLENVIITSKNGARALCGSKHLQQIKNCFTVGPKTTKLLVENGVYVNKTAQNASELAHFIVNEHKKKNFTYFCGKQRRYELPDILKEGGVCFEEIVVYETVLNTFSFDRFFDAILFYSPSGVQSFVTANSLFKTQKAQKSTVSEHRNSAIFCIGETTAALARNYFKNVIVANATTIESTIAKAVTYLKK